MKNRRSSSTFSSKAKRKLLENNQTKIVDWFYCRQSRQGDNIQFIQTQFSIQIFSQMLNDCCDSLEHILKAKVVKKNVFLFSINLLTLFSSLKSLLPQIFTFTFSGNSKSTFSTSFNCESTKPNVNVEIGCVTSNSSI